MAGKHEQLNDIPLEKVVTSRSVSGARKPNLAHGFTTTHDSDATLNVKKSTRPRLGRRKTTTDLASAVPGRPGSAGNDGTALGVMGRVYSTILNFSIITRYFIYVLPIAALLAIPILIGFFAAKNATIQGVKIQWFFIWIEIVWLSLWVSKIVAHFLPKIFTFIVGVVSPGVKKYATLLRNLQMPLSFVGWAVASLLSFSPMMTKNPDTQEKAKIDASFNNLRPGFQTVMANILGAVLVCTIVFFIERLVVQLISINYHRAQFEDKILDNKRSIYLLTLLYDASRSLFPEYCKEFEEEDYIINDAMNLSSFNKTHTHGQSNPLRIIQNVGRLGDKVGAAFGTVAQEITGRRVFDLDSSHSIVTEALERSRSSEALAKRLWLSFVLEGREALYEDDIIEVLGANRRNEATEAFQAIDKDGNGDISLDEMVLTVTEIGKDRNSIHNSMHDVDQAIHVLDNLLLAIVFVLWVLVFVAFLNRNFLTSLTTAGTTLLSLSFIFAATAQEVLGSCIFLFVKHPYNIGDRVDITKEELIVERISLLFTIFKRVKSNNLVQIPNIVLNGLWVENISRSRAMKERLTVAVQYDTTFEDVQLLKSELENFVRDKDNNRDFQPDIDVECTGVGDLNKLELTVEIRHKSNWANESIRSTRRSKFMCALALALKRVPIYAPAGGSAVLGSADAPSYSVAISNDEASANKAAYAVTKESKRMVPTKKDDSATMTTERLSTEIRAGVNLAHGKEDPFQPRDDNSTINEDHGDADSQQELLRNASVGRRAPNQTLSNNTADPYGVASQGYPAPSIPYVQPYVQQTQHQPSQRRPSNANYIQPPRQPYPPRSNPGNNGVQEWDSQGGKF